MPQLFGDEGHEGVKHDQNLVEHPSGNRLCFFINLALDQFQIPVAELIPDKVIKDIRHPIEAQFLERLVERGERCRDFANDPAVDRTGRGRRLNALAAANAISLCKARCVPELGRKVAIALNPLFIHLHIAALAFHRRHKEAQGIRAILINQTKRIDDIALGLGHFLPVRRAHQPMQIERAPGHVLHEVNALHRHARIPEEEDVKAGNENVIGVMARE